MKPFVPLPWLHRYVLVSCVVFLGVQVLKFFSVAAPRWIFNYLNDILLIPMVATLGLYAVWYLRKDNSLRLNIVTILSLIVLFSFVFEYYLPKQSYRYTADIWDVACYFLGGVVFYVLQKIQ